MKERNLSVLEFPKILDRLAGYAVSDLGKAYIRALRPSSDPDTVREWQTKTEEASTIIAYTGGNPMVYFSDVREYVKMASIGATLTMKALLRVAETYRASRAVHDALHTDREDTPLLTDMGMRLATNRSLEEEIFNAILSEDEMSDHASPELYAIRRHIHQINDQVREKLNAMIRSSSIQKYLTDSIITVRNGRYVLPVRADSRQFVPGLVHDQSGSGSTLFIEPMSVVEMGNDLKQWLVKERQEIDRILQMFSAQIAPDASLIANNLDILSELDAVFAKAYFGRDLNAVSPKLNTDERIRLIKARHPLIDPARVVPTDLWMGQDFTTLVITGPNTGGKTVTLKTVGLLTLMAQTGMLIPAQFGSELAIYDEVYADIGDEQSIEQSLSTFSSHMTNIVTILTNVGPQSLVLFDELGAGTDPTEGAALAMSILSHLLSMKVSTLATTHYSELKAFALSTPGVENASVEFDVETLRPTYRLSIGVPGKSNAFEISRKLGLPDALIDDAAQRLTRDQIRFEDVIANAEYHRQVAEKERLLAEQAHWETQRIRNEAEKMRAAYEGQREAMIQKAKEDARKIVTRAQRESEQIISDLKKARSGSTALKEHELHAMRAKLAGELDEVSPTLAVKPVTDSEPPVDLKVGEWVELLHLGTKGIVMTSPDMKGELTVQSGAMKMKVRLSQVRRTVAEKVKKRANTIHVTPRAASMECDVRGMTVEEASTQVDLFLDGAGLNALKTVSIIHGKGTGALRAGLHEHLKRNSSVKSFRLGMYGEGEDGVTIVTLK